MRRIQRMAENYNPFAGSGFGCEEAQLADLRGTHSVREVGPGMFVVTRDDLMRRVMIDHVTFPQGGFTAEGFGEAHQDDLPLRQTDRPFHTDVRRNMAAR